jgi:hypothetical protein
MSCQDSGAGALCPCRAWCVTVRNDEEKTVKRWIMGIAILVILSQANRTNGAIIYDANNWPTYIPNLEVEGTLYNVSITFGEISFNDIFGSVSDPSPTPTFWGDSGGAIAASQAIAAALNADPSPGDPALNSGQAPYVLTPYTDSGSSAWCGYAAWKTSTEQWEYSGTTGIPGISKWPQHGFAQYEAVPEPTSLTLLAGLSLSCIVGWRISRSGRRRRASCS